MSSKPSSTPPPWATRLVSWLTNYRRAIWIAALVLFVPAAWRTGMLYAHLRAELEQLLPPNAPSYVALKELRQRLGGHQFLGIVVEAKTSADVPSAERFLDDLAPRVRSYPKELVAAIYTGDGEERGFLEDHAPLYIEATDLRIIRDRVTARRDYEVSRASGILLDDEAAPSVDFKDIEHKYDDKLGPPKDNRGTRYTDVKRRLSVLLIEVAPTAGPGEQGALLDRIKADAVSLGGPEHYAAGMRFGFAGDAAINVEELHALVADLSFSSVVVLALVVLSILLYYRWWRSMLALVPPLLLATAYAFAVASLPPFGITELNSNTAFLGSIIVGNGINFGLVLLARYVEERRAGADVQHSLAVAVDGARTGTLAAALAAGVSYASLAITQFRGFRQFGMIGGIGMVLSWLAAFFLMPPLISWLDKDESTRPKPVTESARATVWITQFIARAPRVVLAVSAVLTVVAAFEVSRFRSSDIESDFSQLRSRDTWTQGEGYWGTRMDWVIGEYLTPLVYLADDAEGARKIADSVKSSLSDPFLSERVQSVRVLADVVPVGQPEKLAITKQIRVAMTPRVRSSLTDDQRKYVDKLLGKQELAAITIDDLPRRLQTGFRERDGSMGKTVLVFPKASATWWDGDVLREMVHRMRDLGASATSPAPAPRFAGSLPLSSDILESVRSDAPIASLCAFGGVIAVVVLLMRKRASMIFVIGALMIGVLWLAGSSRAFGVKINFANFIAFPITFGIGVDYAVNVFSRYEQEGGTDILAAVRSTGAAVALCSLTTIIGYSSLLMAQNRALYLFGILAVLGEISCLTAAVISLPALVIVLRRFRPATIERVEETHG